MPKDITKENFEVEVLHSDKPVVLDIHATWCGPCQQVAPIFEEVSREMESKCKFGKINVDEARELAIQFGVTSVPTFIFIKNKEVVDSHLGYISKEELKSKIENLIK